MKKSFLLGLAILLSGCSMFDSVFENEEERLPASPIVTEAEYSDFAKNVIVIEQKENYVVYEYKNIRVDDIAVLAALYCHDKDKKRAYLDNITLYHNNARRVRFECR